MKRKIIPYNPKLKQFAKQLRQNMTLSEVLLWDQLKQKKISGYDFDRQRPINEFIVDFYCKDLMLAIEIDGDSHDHEEAYRADQKRQRILEGLGVNFLRFEDGEVKSDIDNVLSTIEIWIEEHGNEEPTPSPSKEGDRFQKRIQNPLLRGVVVGKDDLNFSILLETAKVAARKAAKEILKIYKSGDFNIEAKADHSPLTLADKASHQTIVKQLEETGIPILSEEGRDISFEERKTWKYFWMIDPLDGTKEFIKKNGEFTVNIALIHHDKPVLGVVQVPVTGDIYYATLNKGSFKNDVKISVNSFKFSEQNLKVVASRSHLNDETSAFIEKLNKPVIVSKGSSLKLLMIAEGKADLYPRYAPTMEWDTAASQIIVKEAGGKVLQKNTQDLVVYNKENLLNPHFLVIGNAQ